MPELLIAIIGLILSAFFSMAETAFVTVNRIQLEVKAKHRVRGANEALSFVDIPERYLSTILVGTTLANIMTTSFLTIILIIYLPELATVAVTSTVILLFGEIIPKTIGRDTADLSVPWIAPLLKLTRNLIYPIIYITELVGSLFSFSRRDREVLSRAFSKDDLRVLFDRVSEQGLIDRHESRFIGKLLDFGDITAAECMIPRTRIDAVPDDIMRQELIDEFGASEHSKVLVYHETLDNVKGIIFLKDLFEAPESGAFRIRQPTFVPESKMADELLQEMQRAKQSIVVVVDEYGGTAGIITIEDIIEEIFGEFEIGLGGEEALYVELDSGDLLINGNAEIDRLSDELGIVFPEGDYETIAGLLFDNFGRIPSKGDKTEITGTTYTIQKATPRTIEQVILRIKA